MLVLARLNGAQQEWPLSDTTHWEWRNLLSRCAL